MNYWEFLIQKEGDRLWLPLESPNVEILEGRYRLVVRSSRLDKLVEIRISHQSTEEIPPKRRLQKRSRRTNREGLMVLIPFTYLKPGTWQMRCSGDLMSDLLGEGWQENLTLQVLPREADVLLDEDGDAGTRVLVESKTSQATTADWVEGAGSASSVAAVADRFKGQQTNEGSSESTTLKETTPDLHLIEQVQPPFSRIPLASPSPDNTEILENPVVRLNLDSSTYVACRGQTLTLSGQVDRLEADNSTDVIAPETSDERPQVVTLLEVEDCVRDIAVRELQICLRDPQSAEVLVNIQSSLADRTVPFSFSYMIEIPADCQTRLILGEAILTGIVGDATATVVLAAQSFNITANLDDLLGAIADRFAEDDSLNALSEPSLEIEDLENVSVTEATSLNLSLLALVETPKGEPAAYFRPTNAGPLPPQLYVPNPETSPHRTLELPKIPAPQLAMTEVEALDILAAGTSPTTPSAPAEIAGLSKQESEMLSLFEDTKLTTEVRPVFKEEPLERDQNADIKHEASMLVQAEAQQDVEILKPAIRLDADSVSKNQPLADSEVVTVQPAKPELEIDPLDNWTLEQVDHLKEDRAQCGQEVGLAASLSPIDRAFQSLKLQERFWLRLNAIATDTELSHWLQSQFSPLGTVMQDLAPVEAAPATSSTVAASAVSEEAIATSSVATNEVATSVLITTNGNDTHPQQTCESARSPDAAADSQFSQQPGGLHAEIMSLYAAAGSDADLASQEIVVNEVPLDLEWNSATNAIDPGEPLSDPSPPLPIPSTWSMLNGNLWVDADATIISTPQLIVPQGELTAGKSVVVSILLPETLAKTYVKLWLHDRQTRSLLDGPHWLIDFTPDGAGNLEARKSLTVPFGCLELQIEAIAVEMHTQRESHKVTLDRTVIPEDMPTMALDLPLDDF